MVLGGCGGEGPFSSVAHCLWVTALLSKLLSKLVKWYGKFVCLVKLSIADALLSIAVASALLSLFNDGV